ncbi:class V lanthionine synthetase subunit LxmK [Streptomyces sp. MST-110588]|uniref:class V lanthionine synthetase subunit LxmK n=1 Tax=Streptomyces sp. MST-110588 TaxID=2833628 RepID=UPI001F5CB63D|nr:class V lanthionine synthetase subunit LxmK [Streptomyces sp. MST-110588]UNO41784.1 class IV lanthionine synthetase subunit LxmK [Streptomyces sp. MST-110588]
MTLVDHRYRARPESLESVPAVARLLRRLGLGTFDPAHLTSYNGRNNNWSGLTTEGTQLFVKHLSGPLDDARRRLTNILAFHELLRYTEQSIVRGPRCLGWSMEDVLVVFEWLPDTVTGAERADSGAFGEEDAHRIGETIGALHGLDPSGRVSLDPTPHALPPVSGLNALSLEKHRTASGAELRMWSILQQDGELAEAIRRLRKPESDGVSRPVHGDFRLDQVLFARDAMYLLDFEELRRTDPARDIGAYVGEWLYRAVRKLAGPESPESDAASGAPGSMRAQAAGEPRGHGAVARATSELARCRPFIERFRAGYAARGDAAHDEALWIRSAGFAGWHLLDRVMARSAQRSVLTAGDRAAMGIARTLLLSPGAVTRTLGLED